MWKKTRRSNSDTGRALFLLWYTLSGCEYRARKSLLSTQSALPSERGNFQKTFLFLAIFMKTFE